MKAKRILQSLFPIEQRAQPRGTWTSKTTSTDIPVKDSGHHRPHLPGKWRAGCSRFCRGCLKKRNGQDSPPTRKVTNVR